MIIQRQLTFWGFAFALLLLFVYLFSPVLLPFVLGMVIAYLLNPAVNSLRVAGLGRMPASLFILFVFALVVCLFFVAIIPPAWHELSDLIDNLPSYIERLKALAEPASARINAFLDPWREAPPTPDAAAAAGVAKNILAGFLIGGVALFHVISLLVITPIVAYFMMKEWPAICAWVSGMLPLAHKETIMELLKEIDKKLSAFIRGQLSVAAILGVSYALALTVIGLKYGFLIGLCAGLLSVIPLVGSTVGLITAVIVAWFQTFEWQFVVMVAAIFFAGQLIEGNILTPKIVGGRVGLHPLWIFFAIMAGGALFGFLGVLLAVPVAAIASVLIAFAVSRYKCSSFYTGNGNG